MPIERVKRDALLGQLLVYPIDEINGPWWNERQQPCYNILP
jgi:hypothetical protein